MPNMLVHEAGPQTTVQDLGRRGSLRAGIPPSGPMDREAFFLANRLVGNPDDAAALECTLIGPRIQFADEPRVAVTSPDMSVSLAGAVAPPWAPFVFDTCDLPPRTPPPPALLPSRSP